MLLLNGAYTFGEGDPAFHRLPTLGQTGLKRLLRTVTNRVAPLLERHGLLVRDTEHAMLDPEPGDALDRAGPTLLAKEPGCSLHAATVCEAHQRNRLEKLCRYITWPAIADERISVTESGQVLYRFKQPYRDGTIHVVLNPLDFIARLTALVPRPRLNLTRFHGVFAPNRKQRKQIVPGRKEPPKEDPDQPRAPMTWMQRLKRVFDIDKSAG